MACIGPRLHLFLVKAAGCILHLYAVGPRGEGCCIVMGEGSFLPWPRWADSGLVAGCQASSSSRQPSSSSSSNSSSSSKQG